eukprot:gene18556-20423_t
MLAELKTELKKQIAVPTIINVKEIDTSGFYKMADEEMIVSGSSTQADEKFDNTIGALEDILLDDKFQDLQDSFMDQYYKEFEDTEENKLIYMDIFKEYTEMLEKYIEEKLCKAIDGFSMEQFQSSLESRKDQMDLEIFDMLQTLTDFLEFKQMFLDYKATKEGKAVDFSPGIVVMPLVGVSEQQSEQIIDITDQFS